MTEELLHDRYRIAERNRGRPTVATDVATGQRVLLPEDVVRPGTFLWRARLRAAARAIRRRADPRISIPLDTAPVVLPCPTGWRDHGVWMPPPELRITTAQAVTAALEVVELIAIAGECGASADGWDACIERSADGALHVRLIAPLSPGGHDTRCAVFGLSVLDRWLGRANPVTGLQEERITTDEAPRELIEALTALRPTLNEELERAFPVAPLDALARVAPHSGDTRTLRAACAAFARWEAAARTHALELDECVAMGEEELPRVRATEDEWHARRVRFDLGAVLHRRACLATSVDDAIADAARAAAIDAHPAYLTTLALLHERRADRVAAADAHDRAVAAIAAVEPGADDEHVFADFYGPATEKVRDIDYRESFPERAARTLEARGAFRATQGDVAGAADDLRASLAMHATPSAERRLARLLAG